MVDEMRRQSRWPIGTPREGCVPLGHNPPEEFRPETMVAIGTVNAGMLVMKSYDDSTEVSFGRGGFAFGWE